MSAHVLLNLINKLRKSDKFYRFSSTGLINSIIQELQCKILFIISVF